MKKLLNTIPGWAKSKYTIALTAFVVWMLFFDEQDLITTHYRQPAELQQLTDSRKFYEQEIEKTQQQLEHFKNRPELLEKYAREKYRMKKDNEDLYIIPLQ